MNNIHKSLLLLSLLSAGGLVSCKDQLDINTDPTRPSTASPNLVLPAANGALAYTMGGPLNIQGNFFAQNWTESLVANQYKDYDRYRIGQSTNDRDYQSLYTGALKNFKYVMDRDSGNYAAIAGLQSAYAFQVLNDAFDDIPFTDALNGANLSQPSFDRGEVVYDGLIKMIDRALGRINPDGANAGPQDLVFGGNMDKWRRFGNTLKLKIYLRQVYARPDVSEAGIKALYSSGAEFLGATEHAQISAFTSVSQNSNPLYLTEVASGSGVPNNIIASNTSLDYLRSTNDPRIDFLYSHPGSTPTNETMTAHNGVPQGEAIKGGTAAITTFSRPNLMKIAAASSPVVFLSGPESLFLQAEAAYRGYATGANTTALYNAAIAASFQKLGVPTTGLAAFQAQPDISLTGLSGEPVLQRIITQKWVALNGTEGFEEWTELRRTKYPSFITGTPYSDLPGKTFAKRLVYPTSETTRNAKAPAVSTADVPVWWDKKP